MREELAGILGTAVQRVHIFTVRDVENEYYWDVTPKVDVMFAAHGSSWYRPSRLNGLVWANKAQVLLYTRHLASENVSVLSPLNSDDMPTSFLLSRSRQTLVLPS